MTIPSPLSTTPALQSLYMLKGEKLVVVNGGTRIIVKRYVYTNTDC